MKRRDEIEEEYLTLKERNMLLKKGRKITNGAIDRQQISTALSMLLSSKDLDSEVMLSTGEIVHPTFAENLVITTVKEALQNPSTSKLKDLATILGDMPKVRGDDKEEVESAEALFGQLVVDKKMIEKK